MEEPNGKTLMETMAANAEYERHPLSAVWGNMPNDQFVEMVEEFKKDPKRQMVITYEGKILDGWHRYLMSLAADTSVLLTDLPQGTDPVTYTIIHNGMRRHLTPSQRAGIIVACREWVKDGRPGNIETVSRFPEEHTNAQMAEEAGTSTRLITAARTAERIGLGDQVRSGEISAHAAAQKAREMDDPKPEAAIIDMPASEANGKAKSAKMPMSKVVELQETIDRQHQRIEELEEENRMLQETGSPDPETSRVVASQRAIIRSLESTTRILNEDKNNLLGQTERQRLVIQRKDLEIADLKKELEKLQVDPILHT